MKAVRGGRLWLLTGLLLGCGAKSELLDEEIVPCVVESVLETCNGVDDDCDGLVDEGIEPVRCGEHGCETVVSCVDGEMPACVPRTPAPESCNLLDDDCDGEVDEGLGFGPLGDAVLLRRDEGETGGCTSCRWAWGTALAPVGEGFLALWNLGLYGGAEQPTLHGRLVDRSGQPLEDVRLLREDYILGIDAMQALAPLPERGLPFDAIYRAGGSDVPGFLFVGAQGGIETAMPTPAFGPGNVARTVWTGERFISAWEADDGLQVASLSADAGDERRIDVDRLERPGAITFGTYPGRVGILVSRYRDMPERRDQWLVVLDEGGEVLAPARQIDVEYATWQRLVGTAEGWLHIRPGPWGESSTRQTLDLDGDPTSEALEFEDGRRLGDSGLQDAFALHPVSNGIVTVWQWQESGEMRVELLDGVGDTLSGWSGPVPLAPGEELGFLTSPHITFVDDQILVIWHGLAPDGQANPVWVRGFGCVP